jgi:hypothetical protein
MFYKMGSVFTKMLLEIIIWVRANVIKLFMSVIFEFPGLAGVLRLEPTRMKHLSASKKASDLAHKHYTTLERLVRDKHSSP